MPQGCLVLLDEGLQVQVNAVRDALQAGCCACHLGRAQTAYTAFHSMLLLLLLLSWWLDLLWGV